MEMTELIRYFLPEEIIDNFEVVDIKAIGLDVDAELHIYLDEKFIYPPAHAAKNLESKGFLKAVKISDFPIRDKKVLLLVRRRKWKDMLTGNIYTRTFDLKHKGTNYTKEFAAFLKENPG
ncbi:MAG: transposase [Bacteroidetes bacterium]|nr:transposase [Bacteroidota bacterium]